MAKDDKPEVQGGLEKGKDLGGDEVQKKMDEEQAQGFRGLKSDPTPDENYTVAGVTGGKPTPETDPKTALKAGSSKFVGIEAEKAARPEPPEMITLVRDDSNEIQVSPKLRSNYVGQGYKEKGGKK